MRDGNESGSRRRIASSLIVLAIAASALVVAATGAIFTDTASVGSNTFTTGTIDLTTTPSTALLTASTMAPGDMVDEPLTVSNAGSLQLRYAVQASADDTDSKNLRGSLKMRVASQAGGSCDFPYYNTDGSTTTLTDDTQLYATTGLPTSATNIIGDTTQGSQAGDRTLNAGANEVLCFAVVLPTSAGNTVQDATTTATFSFVAEQTANN